MNEIRKFLKNLFEDKPDNTYMLIWTLPDKKSRWFVKIDNAVKAVKNLLKEDKKYNIYAGVGLAEKNKVDDLGMKKEIKRCKAREIKGISSLWADIDVAGEGHKKENLPPTKKEAKKLLNELPLKPSMIIDSGHGLQAWWLFKESWVFDKGQEREEASSIARRWIYTIKEQAKKHNWDIDATTDLSRVMRVAGTFNNKTEKLPVKIIEQNSNRYNPTEFEPFLVDIERMTLGFNTSGLHQEIDDLDLKKDAHPPFDKWEALRSIEPKVLNSWEHNRDDLQDQSASSYDMSLAVFCAMAEWSDNEIAHLLIAHRRKNNEDLKLRQDYYKRTIAKARKMASKNQAEKNIDKIIDTADKVDQEGNDIEQAEVKKATLNVISNLFGVQINKFIKFTSDPPQYRIETEKGNIMMGGASSILRQSTFRANILAATNIVIPKFKGKKWDNIIQALMKGCTEESLGEEATNQGTARVWINNYLSDKTILEEKEEAVKHELPFKDNEKIYIFGSDFREWLKINQEKINSKEMGAILRSYNCEPVKINVELNESRTTRGVWKLPQQLIQSYK